VQWKGRHWSVVLGSYGGVIAAIFLPYNNDLHDRPVTVDEVTGRGFKATVLMVKDNKYCYDKMRVEMTDGKRFFFVLLFKAMCVFYRKHNEEKHSSSKRVTEAVKCGSERKRKEKVSLFLSKGSFITINGVVTQADIQIDLPSSGDHSAGAEVSHTKDSFVSLMKGFLPKRFFKIQLFYTSL